MLSDKSGQAERHRDPDLSGRAYAVRLETAPTEPGSTRGGLECLINSKIYYKKKPSFQVPRSEDARQVGKKLGFPELIHTFFE